MKWDAQASDASVSRLEGFCSDCSVPFDQLAVEAPQQNHLKSIRSNWAAIQTSDKKRQLFLRRGGSRATSETAGI
jgi:hypothetical protein